MRAHCLPSALIVLSAVAVHGCAPIPSVTMPKPPAIASCPQWELLDRFRGTGTQDVLTNAFLIDSHGNYFYDAYVMPDYSPWLVRRSSDRGKTWSTVENFAITPRRQNYALGMTEDADGSLYVAGVVSGPSDTRGLIRKSSDQGVTWTTVDDQLTPGAITCKTYDVKAVDGALFALGRCGNDATYHWVVRRSRDAGRTWSNVDVARHASARYAKPAAIVRTAAGSLIVLGIESAGDSVHWLMRRSLDHGDTWADIDRYRATPGQEMSVGSLSVTTKGSLLAAGWVHESDDRIRGLIRRSEDDGVTWSTTDEFVYLNQRTLYQSVVEDSWGRLYVLASTATGGLERGIIRRSQDEGVTWEDFLPVTAPGGVDAIFQGPVIGPANQLFVTGMQGRQTPRTGVVLRLQLLAPAVVCR
jgi:hypothetical protein